MLSSCLVVLATDSIHMDRMAHTLPWIDVHCFAEARSEEEHLDSNHLLLFAVVCLLETTIAWLLLRNLNHFLMSRGVYGTDVNKPTRNKVPEEGGISICISFIFSLWLFGQISDLSWVVPLIAVTALVCMVGFIDFFRDMRPLP
ncbi:MAG: hypothetical protein KAV87_43440 [Desulfobacteraceae bacterium]|nr:hypothetical protein [Desulfobacteraceae bacterium]